MVLPRIRTISITMLALMATCAAGASASSRLAGGDQASANSAIIHRADLGAATGWKGGVQKIDLGKATGTLTSTCSGYDAAGGSGWITAVAGSHFYSSGIEVMSSALIARSASMVTRDLRGMRSRTFRECFRKLVAAFFDADPKAVTVTRLGLPNVAAATVAYRGTTTYASTTRRYVLDLVGFRRGRTEAMTAVVLSASDLALVRKADLNYARIVAGRI
jgi:hypothetical protein